jgi:hypothetical protein
LFNSWGRPFCSDWRDVFAVICMTLNGLEQVFSAQAGVRDTDEPLDHHG